MLTINSLEFEYNFEVIEVLQSKFMELGASKEKSLELSLKFLEVENQKLLPSLLEWDFTRNGDNFSSLEYIGLQLKELHVAISSLQKI